MSTPEQSPEKLAEDVADLTARVNRLVSQLDATQQLAESLNGQGREPASDGQAEQPSAPPLILKLTGEEYDQELAALSIWVEYVLAPVYLTEVSSSAPWCPRWWEHDGAVARLHGLWLAWQELTTPEVGGYTGPSVWTRDHLRPAMDELRSPNGGPFAACTTNPSRPQHSVSPPPPVAPLPQLVDAGDES